MSFDAPEVMPFYRIKLLPKVPNDQMTIFEELRTEKINDKL